jgi:hypothetical protein
MIPHNQIDTILAAGLPWYINEDIHVQSPKLKKIFKIGEELYNFYCSLMVITSDSFIPLVPKEIPRIVYQDFSPYQCLCFGTEYQFLGTYSQDALSFFCEVDIQFDDLGFYFVKNDKQVRIDEDVYLSISKAISTLQMIKKPEKPKFLNKAAEEAFKHMQKMREKYKVNQAKQKESGFGNLIDTLCNISLTINRFNVQELTLYQLITDLEKQKSIDNYRLTIPLSPYLDKKAKMPDHWMKPINY